MSGIRVRFAPSPTGNLHLGNARTALFNWLFARSRGGSVVLRIEDTDTERSSPRHEAGLMEDLRWLGLGWDEGVDEGGEYGPYRQSERLEAHHLEAERLVADGLAYPCFCDPERLDRERIERRAAGRALVYSGRCRRIPPHEAAERRGLEPHVLRFNLEAAAGEALTVEFQDRIHGTVRFPVSQIGDFVLLRRDGRPSYDLAVVVDDYQMGITHVIRGDDELSNTPQHVLLGRALGAAPLPEFAHLPLIVGPGGAPLSKCDGDLSLAWFRKQGYPPEALINALTLLGWSAPGGQQLLTREEILASFDLAGVSKASAVFDRQKLDALSLRHMARLPEERLASLASEHLQRAGVLSDPIPPGARDWIGRLAWLFADRLSRMADLRREASMLFDFEASRASSEAQVMETLSDMNSRVVMKALIGRIGEEPLSAQSFQGLADEVRRETGAKGRHLYHPLRVALTGAASGPDLAKLIPIIEEGHRLKLARPIPSCSERARALLGVSTGTSL
jgi:glutamyl-tRNA synthetase